MAAEATTAPPAERRFRAMGSDCHLIIHGGPPGLADVAQRRIAQLEERWSRFVPDSEVSRLNAAAGHPVVVSDDTRLLIDRAVRARELTGGRFEPTVLGDLVRAGYARSLDDPGGPPRPRVSELRHGALEIAGRTATVAADSGLDPGGIGKGLAADIVADLLRAAGAAGACVNIGGDLRVWGRAGDADGWMLAIEHPHLAAPLAVVGLRDGAIATSTSLLRRWATADGTAHHLIDPATGAPSTSDLALVSVICAEAWLAEVHATATLLAGEDRGFALLAGTGIAAIAVTTGGHVVTTPDITRFTAGRRLPARVEVAQP